MKIFSFCGGVLLCFLVSLIFGASICYADLKTVEVVGVGECTDCAQNSIQTSHAFSGLHVTIDCKLANGHFKTRGVGELNEEGEFKVFLPKEIEKDGKLKEECYAQLHNAQATPCAAHDGLQSNKIVFKSKSTDGKQTFGVAGGKLKFSPETCTSAHFLPHFKSHPFFNHPIFKKPLPPPVPIFKKPLPPPVPIFKKPLPPPVPIFKKPLPPPVPEPKKPLPLPAPKPKKSLPPPAPKPKKSLPSSAPKPKKSLPPPIPKPKEPLPPPAPKKVFPPPVPVKKPLPPPVPVFKKPLPPPVPIFKKPLPPPIPFYKPKPHPFFKPLPPLPKIPPFFKKPPCPPLAP